jgi:predicted GTPase
VFRADRRSSGVARGTEADMAHDRRNVLILGAAGRDFHNFNVVFRDDARYRVQAFTAFQIPGIAGRRYPPQLAGPLYPNGIPIHDEAELPVLLRRCDVDEVVFSYSDVAYDELMHRASIVTAAGADFRLLGGRSAMIGSSKPVLSVCAVRTGVGKSQTSRAIAAMLRARGRRVVVIRHPMPYDKDLAAQRVQRFARIEDLLEHRCTIEEREEYEPHIVAGNVVYAGVDYAAILAAAEAEADVVLWDGGNNDTPFYRPDLHVVLVDPHRPGHETRYWPGETNLRMADVVLVNKTGTATPEGIAAVRASAARLCPRATVVLADSEIRVSDAAAIRGKRVLVVEDGPTVTHGEMAYGAGWVAAKRAGAAAIVDPRPFAVGSLRDVFAKYGHLHDVLPAMGYGEAQMRELEQTIAAVPCDAVVVGTPVDLGRFLKIRQPQVRVSYELDAQGRAGLEPLVDRFLERGVL